MFPSEKKKALNKITYKLKRLIKKKKEKAI